MNILEGTAKDFSDLLKQYLEFSTYKDSNWGIVDIRDVTAVKNHITRINTNTFAVCKIG